MIKNLFLMLALFTTGMFAEAINEAEVAAENPLTKRFSEKETVEIKKILTEMGVNAGDVKIVEANTMGANGAVTERIKIGENEYTTFYADPNWWGDADSEVKRFLIGHEGTHILNRDVEASMARRLFLLLGVAVSSAFVAEILSHSRSRRLSKMEFIEALIHLCIPAILLTDSLFCRKDEKRADLNSATKLNAADGGIKFFEEIIEENKKRREEGNVLARFFKKIIISKDGNNRLDWSHPALTERIKYLNELLEQQ